MTYLRQLKSHWQLITLIAIVFALWNQSVVVPLKIFVVFLHEASHALATLFTGGQVEALTLSPRQGGHVISRGGNLFIIASSGYLGSLIFGGVFFLLGLRTHLDKYVVGAIGLFMFVLTAFYIRDLFPIMFCIAGGVFLCASAVYLSRPLNDLLLRLLGLTSMIYVPYDIMSDTILRSEILSDAKIIAQHYGGSGIMWGSLWLMISSIVLLFIIKVSWKYPSNIAFKSSQTPSAD